MPKLTLPGATVLISKLSRTGGFPEDKEVLTEMALTLMKAAPDAEVAALVIQELRETCVFCPPDAKFFEAARKVAPPPEPAKPPEHRPFAENAYHGCRVGGGCDGSGWLSFVVRDRRGMLVDAAKPCVCRAGVVAPVEAPPARGTRKMKQVAADYAKKAAGEGEEV